MLKRQPKILFFIGQTMPTNEDYAQALNCGNNVVFRNASVVDNTCNPENCDGVAGAVPKSYKRFPTAEKALGKFAAELKAQQEAENEIRKAREEGKRIKKEEAEKLKLKLDAAKQEKAEAIKKVAEVRHEQSKQAQAQTQLEEQPTKWVPNR